MRPTGLQRRAGPFKVKAPVGWAVRRRPWGFLAMPADTPRLFALSLLAAVVLSGTSLLGGRGNLVATAVAALFLSQLDQFVLALGVTYATRTLVQAAALGVGVALYTDNWGGLVRRLRMRRPASMAPT